MKVEIQKQIIDVKVLNMKIGIGTLRIAGVSDTGFTAPDNMWLKGRVGLTLPDASLGGNDAAILPSVGKIQSTDYLKRSYTDFGLADASGYVEIKFYNSGAANIRNLFCTGSSAASQRYVRFYMNINKFYFTIRNNLAGGGGVFFNGFYIVADLSVGWHTVRVISDGSNYSAILDGGAPLTAGAGILISTGLDNGKWYSSVITRNTLEIGSYTDNGGTTVPPSEHNIAYVDYNNKNKWYISGAGNKVVDLIGAVDWTWTGTDHQGYSASGDTILLDSGFSKWYKAGEPIEYIPYKAGAPFDVSAFLVGYANQSDHPGSAAVFNLAPGLIDFDPLVATPAELTVMDRSNVTYQSAASRASDYYDAGFPYRYHSEELANPIVYNTLWNAGYKGMYYAKITTYDDGLNFYCLTIGELLLYSVDKTGATQTAIMAYCGSDVFFLNNVGNRFDADGYRIVLLTDIKQFGASPANDPLVNLDYMQRAIEYYYNNTLTFGGAGELYEITQPLNLVGNKTYTIDSTLRLKDGTVSRLTQNYVAGQSHIHVASTEGFNTGEWVTISDDLQVIYYSLGRCGFATRIISIDRENKIIYFDPAECALPNIWNLSILHNARVGHTQNCLLAEYENGIVLTGNGLIDNNYQNQHGLNGCLVNDVFEEHRTNCGFTAWICDDTSILGTGLTGSDRLNFKNGLRHNINITGFDPVETCDRPIIRGVLSTDAYNKNCNIRYCTDWIIEDYEGNDAVEEDGLMFYLGNINGVINRISCKRNGRNGIGWNSAHGEGLVATDIITADNKGAGIAISAKDAVFNNVTMSDVLSITYTYANATNIVFNNIAISDHDVGGDFWGALVRLSGAIDNITFNNLTITNCIGIGIYAFPDFVPSLSPTNVTFNGGGIYSHTGECRKIFWIDIPTGSQSTIEFNDFWKSPCFSTYGILYNYWAVNEVRNIAPIGWHVPSMAEFNILIAFAGIEPARKLKALAGDHWYFNNNGTDDLGFSLFGAGYKSPAGWLSNTPSNPDQPNIYAYGAYLWVLEGYFSVRWDETIFGYTNDPTRRREGASVRCIRDNAIGWVVGEQITDIDGIVYDTVMIGTQIWMKQNLAVKHYRNGDAIELCNELVCWQNDNPKMAHTGISNQFGNPNFVDMNPS